MRTRRSPRNQEILWNALFAPNPEPGRSKIDVLTALLARPDLKPRDRKAFEKQLQTAKIREATNRAPSRAE